MRLFKTAAVVTALLVSGKHSNAFSPVPRNCVRTPNKITLTAAPNGADNGADFPPDFGNGHIEAMKNSPEIHSYLAERTHKIYKQKLGGDTAQQYANISKINKKIQDKHVFACNMLDTPPVIANFKHVTCEIKTNVKEITNPENSDVSITLKKPLYLKLSPQEEEIFNELDKIIIHDIDLYHTPSNDKNAKHVLDTYYIVTGKIKDQSVNFLLAGSNNADCDYVIVPMQEKNE